MDKIMMVHGSGGAATGQLIDEIFGEAFGYDKSAPLEDAAVVEGGAKLAITTDSFVVTPLEFRGGDIGRLCVCGTVNDLLMRGAEPKYLTAGFILEEGLDIETLKRVVKSMAATAAEAGVKVVTGDTKVVEGNGGLYINTAGVGIVGDWAPSAADVKAGDKILVSGTMGDHHATILSNRLSIATDVASDNAPLTQMVTALKQAGIQVHTLRDVTRGGLATVLKELAEGVQLGFDIEEKAIPVTDKVKDFSNLLGLDPLYMGNERKLVAIVPADQADQALEIIRSAKYGENAAVIGSVTENHPGQLIMKTPIGGLRNLNILQGEGLPRIC
ncbi:MAG: hydrogenase expression/formation protein HypE [Lachnospiraceae bacterium]|nr:hydrogenase expression/formation protein HypE [Candidatus Equihabitans merdae]